MKSFKLENGTKVKIFTQADLTEKLGMGGDEVKIVMKYQKEFPELLLNFNF